MKEHLEKRPKKELFDRKQIISFRDKAARKIKSKFLPNDKIIKIILIGSAINGFFGKYDPPGFRDSLFSDFDFIIFVEDDYKIPKWLNREHRGKPFPDDKLNLAYRQKKFIENKYDVEIFFIRRKNMEDPKIQKLGEQAGIPMTSRSKHKHLVIYGEEIKE